MLAQGARSDDAVRTQCKLLYMRDYFNCSSSFFSLVVCSITELPPMFTNFQPHVKPYHLWWHTCKAGTKRCCAWWHT